jgi:hypothetical protein
MSEFLRHTMGGAATLQASTVDIGAGAWVKEGGPDFTCSGTYAGSADPSVQSLYYWDTPAGTPEVTKTWDFNLASASGSSVLLDVRRQPDGSRYTLYLDYNGNAGYYHESAAGVQSALWERNSGSGGTLVLSIPGWVRVRLTLGAAFAGAVSMWSSSLRDDVVAEAGPQRVLNEQALNDPSSRIAAAGLIGFRGRHLTLGRVQAIDGAVSPSGTVSGNAALAEIIASGGLSSTLPGSIVTLPFSRNPGNGARPVSLPNNAIAILSDDPSLQRLAGASGLLMGSDGRLTLANAIPAPAGTSVIAVTREADGKLGVERYQVS